MTPEEQIKNMLKAISQAIKAMGDRFESYGRLTSQRIIQDLKTSIQPPPTTASGQAEPTPRFHDEGMRT
jgi:hypothetical protein